MAACRCSSFSFFSLSAFPLVFVDVPTGMSCAPQRLRAAASTAVLSSKLDAVSGGATMTVRLHTPMALPLSHPPGRARPVFAAETGKGVGVQERLEQGRHIAGGCTAVVAVARWYVTDPCTQWCCPWFVVVVVQPHHINFVIDG